MSFTLPSGGIVLPEQSAGDRATQFGSSHHFTGTLVIGDGPGRRLGTESHIEQTAALILLARPDTLSLVEQKLVSWYDVDGKRRKHFVDLVAETTDGFIGYAVRPLDRADQAYILKLAHVREQTISQGTFLDLRLFTEKDVCPIELFNARLFHGVRRPEQFGDPVAAEVVRRMSGVSTVGALVDATRLEGMGFRALVRLIRSGHLKLVNDEMISHHSQVFKAKEL